MSSDTSAAQLREIYLQAIDIDDPREREAFLSQACGDATAARAHVDKLLAKAGQAADQFLQKAVVANGSGEVDTGETNLSNPEALGIQETADEPIRGLIDVSQHPMIGHYKLLEEIGHGGMGTVYMAQQTEPVKRKVALKVIKPGMDSKEVIARFEAERQALAMMDHAHIAKVLDGGTTDEGRPYFVMELVRGVPITEYCKQKKLPLRERLELFVDICKAVQHAHQKGIIHRDLKPSNIMITLYDGQPVPKVIDFGVAKALNQELTERTLFTQYSQMIGTPLYMAPEQAEMSGLDIDTRSDIYSLGVILYELLTGTTPFDRDTMSRLGMEGIRKLIKEQEPQRPSARISTLKAANFSTVEDQRTLDSEDIAKQLKRELDWIVMKALEKDRERRYDTANAFAADVQRYLNDEPVQACPPTLSYRLKKYAKKNKVWLTTAALLVLMLLTSTAVSGLFAIQANEAKQEAIDAKQLADERLAQSRVDFDRALKSMDTIVEELSSAEFAQLPGVEAVRADILKKMMDFYDEIIEDHDNDPYARMQQAVALKKTAWLYGFSIRERQVEQLNKAVSLLEALIEEFPEDFVYEEELGGVLFDRFHAFGRSEEQQLADAERLLKITLKGAKLGRPICVRGTPLIYLKVASKLPVGSKRSQELLEASLQFAHDHNIDPHPDAYHQLAVRASSSGDHQLAIENYVKCIAGFHKMGQDPAKRKAYIERWLATTVQRELAKTQVKVGDLQSAEQTFREAYTAISRLHQEYPAMPGFQDALAHTLNDLINFLRQTEQFEDVPQLLKVFPSVIKEDNPNVADLHRIHGRLLSESEDAVAALTKAIEDFPDVGFYFHQRGEALRAQGELERARNDFEKVLELEDSPSVQLLVLQAEVLNKLNRRSEAVRIYDKAIQLQIEQTGNAKHLRPGHGDFLYSNKDDRIEELSEAIKNYPTETGYYQYRGAAYRALGEFEKALADADRSIELAKEGERYAALFSRALTHIAMGNDRAAIDDYNQILEFELPDWDDIQRRGACYFRLGEFDKALADLQEGMKRLPTDLSKLFDVPPSDVARCENEGYRRGYLELVDDVVEMNEESTAALVARAAVRTAFEEFQQARQDLEIVLTREDATYYVQYQAALLALKLEDVERYRQLSLKMLQAPFANLGNDNGNETHFTAWTCALGPNAIDDYDAAIAFARHSAGKAPDNQQYLNGLGAILMRAGKYEAAKEQLVKALEAGENDNTSPSYIHYFLAMTEHHLGHADDAQEELTQANASADKELADSPTWNRKLTLELLRKEAEALINSEEETSSKKENNEPENN